MKRHLVLKRMIGCVKRTTKRLDQFRRRSAKTYATGTTRADKGVQCRNVEHTHPAIGKLAPLPPRSLQIAPVAYQQ